MVCVFEWKKVDNLILEPQNRRKEGSTDTCMDDGKDEIGEDEKTEFDVELTAFDEAKKLKVIKAIKDITGVSLGEAKEIVVGAPKTVKTGVSKEEAEELKKQLEEQGATVTIK